MQGATTTGRGRRSAPALVAVLLLPLGTAQAQSPQFEQCVLELIQNAASDVTVGEIRATCREAEQTVAPAAPVAEPQPPKSAIDRRLALEGATGVVPFVVTPHKPNYIIYSYNFEDYDEARFEQERGVDQVHVDDAFEGPRVGGMRRTVTSPADADDVARAFLGRFFRHGRRVSGDRAGVRRA